MIKDNEAEGVTRKAQQASAMVEDVLARILQSANFRESLQFQSLLKYIVTESLHGTAGSLKERIIGVEVFGRSPDYDTTEDPIVRSRVGQLRKRLARYYESSDSVADTFQIVIPNGTYRPLFVPRGQEQRSGVTLGQNPLEPQVGELRTSSPVEPAGLVPSRQRPPLRSRKMQASLLIACGLLLSVVAYLTSRRPDKLDLFWRPIIQDKRLVLLYTGTMPAYLRAPEKTAVASSSKTDALPAYNSLRASGQDNQRPNDLFLFEDGLAPSGDITADMRVAALMNSFGRSLSLRSGANLPFQDLRGSPLVLIGAYDNYWTIDLASTLPFYFDRVTNIRERDSPHRIWSSVARNDATIADDYAIVFRLVSTKVGAPVLAIAGLTSCGTQAAAEFVTDSAQFKAIDISRSALEHKNLEFVLHTTLTSCTPTSVDVVAIRAW